MALDFSSMGLSGAGYLSDSPYQTVSDPLADFETTSEGGTASGILQALPDNLNLENSTGPISDSLSSGNVSIGNSNITSDGNITGYTTDGFPITGSTSNPNWSPSSTDTTALGTINGIASALGSTANGNGTSSTGDSGSIFSGSYWTSLFLRILVMILGLVFIGIGLSLFSKGDEAAIEKLSPTEGIKERAETIVEKPRSEPTFTPPKRKGGRKATILRGRKV